MYILLYVISYALSVFSGATGLLGSIYSAATNAYQLQNTFPIYSSFSNAVPAVPAVSSHLGSYPVTHKYPLPAAVASPLSLFSFMPSAYSKPAFYPVAMKPGHMAYHPYHLQQQAVTKSVLYSVLLSELLRRAQG